MRTILFHIALVTGCVIALPREATAGVNAPPVFREAFALSLGDYWCEPNHLGVGDVDGDGHMDVLMMTTALANSNGPPGSYHSQVRLLRGNGDGTFQTSIITNFPGAYGYSAVLAELNNDGSPDLILRVNTTTHILLNNGHGEFRAVWAGPAGNGSAVTAVDANHDGFLDLVSGNQTGQGGRIDLVLNGGSGTNFTPGWQSRIYGSDSDSIETVLMLNLNGDAYPDLAAREIYGGRLVTLLGTNGPVPFVENRVMTFGERTFALAGGRVNGDGLDDLVACVGWGQVRVFLNQGDGSMSNYWESPNLGQAAFNLALADFDGDGANDIFVGTFGTSATRMGTLLIYRNIPGKGFEEWWRGELAGPGYTGSVADVNEDGRPDLIVGEEHHLRVLLNWTGHPEITSFRRSSEGTVVEWRSTPGGRYQVQFKDQLDGQAWTALGETVTAWESHASVTDGSVASSSGRFYRIEQLQ